ncbi:DNA primase family protein [Sulfuriroseicoccus oceanibius]|uniref:Uncharacterized protein n=1 Tax=Sulfuriroseicoccus oceanibius TaxID=2707525 RepID=A0A6B3L304_9BACT|nr:phage/plasmid primase, P4 family [Sulfuriroseicoccus oceanibius]QQL44232.1 hypothetical protein G3M56_010035 [Sulfuriroseicoccus oceanibius]
MQQHQYQLDRQLEPLEPRSPDLAAIIEGAGKAKHYSTAEDAISQLIKDAEFADFCELALEYIGHKLLNAEGKVRKPTAKEAAVIIAEHFKKHAEHAAGGLARINGSVHYFTGKHWQPLEAECLESSLGQFAEAIGHCVTDSRYYESRRKLAEQLRTVTPQLQPTGGSMVNFSNGTLELKRDREVMTSHSKAHGFTYVLPFNYSPDADCPIFKRYLDRALPDAESQQLVSEFFGWIFLRDLKLEKMLVLLGHGHNGKSVLFDIMSAMLGADNISNISFDSLKKPESRLPMLGKLLNYGSEIAGSVPPDTLKKASSGEPLEFRRLYQDLVTSKDYARLAFNANNLPSLTEQTEGFFRRFLIVPFEQTITPEERDPDLARKIIESELPGVMNWVLSGMRRVRERKGFSPCAKSDECLRRYKLESDSVALFLDDEGLAPSASEQVLKGELYQEYRNYCADNGYRACGKREFGARLTKQHRIFEHRTSTGRYWLIEKSA